MDFDFLSCVIGFALGIVFASTLFVWLLGASSRRGYIKVRPLGDKDGKEKEQ